MSDYRNIFIGLGGTGGKVLDNLCGMLTEEQKQNAAMLYLDLDKKDTSRITNKGVETVRISSADTVRDVASSLGAKDGVWDWLPCDGADRRFLASGTDDGASQYRYKSRLCLAKFLSNRNNKLYDFLKEQCKPGLEISEDTLRVIIVSSIAGGTGAGTFIEIALYIRNFFRSINHRDVRITGLFACPDLFVQNLANNPGDETKRSSMLANAYAAIRELNAMNLAVSNSGEEQVESDYGKAINIAINTKSEGKLFDSKDPLFTEDYNTKPFDLLYFVDLANKEGGILSSLDQYYKVMADTAYTRMFSPLEDAIRSDESNELASRSKYPTAIYGSAGYSRIIYPYEDIIRYLARRKTCDELNENWDHFENQWQNYCMEQQEMSFMTGTPWTPTAEMREQHFISEMKAELSRDNSRFRSLVGMIREKNAADDRAAEYLAALDAEIATCSGINSDIQDGRLGLMADDEALNLRNSLADAHAKARADKKNPINRLADCAGAFSATCPSYMNKLLELISGRALYVSSLVIPQDAMAGQKALAEKDAANLYFNLLQLNGNDIHPLAARYLLYRVRSEMRKYVKDYPAGTAESAMSQAISGLNQAFDLDNDNIVYSVSDKVKDLKKTFFIYREDEANSALKTYLTKAAGLMENLGNTATNELRYHIYKRVIKALDALISQYEGFFDNLEQYKSDLQQKTRMDAVRHSNTDDRCIFVGASPEDKERYYRADARTLIALNGGYQEMSKAAGKGIYDAMMTRAWKKLEDDRTAAMLQGYELAQKKDTFSDLGQVFEQVVDIYAKYLREKAPHLQMSVVTALQEECCAVLDRTPDTLSPTEQGVVQHRFAKTVRDMIAKAYPMINYTARNTDAYFTSEDIESEASLYAYLGICNEALTDLMKVFPANQADQSLDQLKDEIDEKNFTVSDEFSRYELVCFRAVHCLQPTQVLKFREDQPNGYFPYYQKRLEMAAANNCLSFSPHIDKRWHLRDAMPYISRSLEVNWRKETAIALLYQMMCRGIRFTDDANGVRCFVLSRKGKAPVYLAWPEGKLILPNNVSLLAEYLTDQNELVTESTEKMRQALDIELGRLANYTDSLSVYKGEVTRSKFFKLLRTDLLSIMQVVSSTSATHGKNAKKLSDNLATEKEQQSATALHSAVGNADSDRDALNQKKTMGGLLEVAWMVHKSEEALKRDHDNGEALLQCMHDIIEQVCQNMFGQNVTPDTNTYHEYVDLYNSILEKFLAEFVVSFMRRQKLQADQLTFSDNTVFHNSLRIPDVVRNSIEYTWIEQNWQKK